MKVVHGAHADLLLRRTRVGKILMSQSASTLKKLSMELGGNAPFIGK